jgi:serine/threonine protein kinase
VPRRRAGLLFAKDREHGPPVGREHGNAAEQHMSHPEKPASLAHQRGDDGRAATETPLTHGRDTVPAQGAAARALAQVRLDGAETLSMTLEPAGPEPGTADQTLSLAAGDIIGQYELIRVLGRGGMGEVHLARDLRLGRLVAIKLLITRHPALSERFLAEARTTAACHHENIVVIHEVGEDVEHGGHPFMVLEYLEGQTLRQWLEEHAATTAASSRTARVPPSRAVELMLPVVRALAYAHERGIVHRDLKPENIVLTRAGTIKVLDFGIAKLLSSPTTHEQAAAKATAGSTAVASSTLIGTLPYMSPEQMNVGAIDHRSDLWAVGVMLFELVTGRHPVAAQSIYDLLRVADEDVPMPGVHEAVPDIGPLGAIIDRCLIKRPEHRTASARALLAELEALTSGRRPALASDDGNPFAGLAAFQEADASRFFGRDREIDQVVSELRSRPLVAVVGPSGVGKSSLIRAGAIPALKRSGEGWDACIVRPGRGPLFALAGALAQMHCTALSGDGELADSAGLAVVERLVERLRSEPGYLGARLRARASSKRRRLLIFVDQFEELYTQGAPPDERAAFLACLAAVADDAASSLRVILSMRSDFLDRLADERHLSTEVTRGLLLLPPMGREGLREALIRPLEACELRFEADALVDRMIGDLDATPGALPLLQFTAARLWELRDVDRRLLTAASYEQLGGVAGALASHADAVLAGMPPSRQAVARVVLERLVTPERTRALVSMDEWRTAGGDPEAVDAVVQHLASMRLVVIEGGGAEHTVELVHESLIARWPTLRRWLDENQEDAVFLARLRGAALQWERSGRDQGMLWRGEPAREAQRWQERRQGPHGQREQAYLDAVCALATRSASRQRRLVAGIMAALVMLLVAATVALLRIQRAEREAHEHAARAERNAATVREQLTEIEAKERELRDLVASEMQARARAQESQRTAEQAQQQAETEAERARNALAEARDARDRAVAAAAEARRAGQAETMARAAEAEAQREKRHAEAAAEKERKAREARERLIQRVHRGPISKTLRRQ